MRDTNASFETLRLLLEKLRDQAGAKHADQIQRYQIELAAAQVRYALDTTSLYLDASGSELRRDNAQQELKRVILAGNFEGVFRRILNGIVALLEQGSAPGSAPNARGRAGASTIKKPARSESGLLAEISRVQGILSDKDSGRSGKCWVERVDCESCPDCRVATAINTERSEASCPNCRRVFQLHGTVFEDAQFYSQEGQKAKSGCFNPNRHYGFWMERILALEPESEIGDKSDPVNQVGEKLLDRLRTIAKRDSKYIQLITVDNVRDMLKELGRTDLNKNASQIIKRLTGKGPPTISEEKKLRGEMLFSKTIDMREMVSVNRSNRNYYPYYIYKIYDEILEERDPDRAMLWFIHLQGDDTLSSNDAEWRLICEQLPELTWRSTSRHMALRYRKV